MDNLTHSLAGAVLGQMGLKKKTGLGMATLIIAANIPDIDAVAVLLEGQQHLALRRGITHGPVAMLILPLILTGIMIWFDGWQTRRWKRPDDRLPIHKGWLLTLAYIGCLSHPALDWLNSYGIRLLEPFSSKWFYGDSIFIIDVWMWAALIAGVWVSRRREKKARADWQRPAWFSFAAICAYIFANGLITGYAERSAKSDFHRVSDGKRVEVEAVREAVANPVPIFFWRREVIIKDESIFFAVIPFSLISGFSYEAVTNLGLSVDDMKGLEKELGGNINVDAFLFWSRFPYIEFDQSECSFDLRKSMPAFIRDARFYDDVVKDRFSVPVMLPPAEGDKVQ